MAILAVCTRAGACCIEPPTARQTSQAMAADRVARGREGADQRRGLDQALERRDEPRSVSQSARSPLPALANPPLRQRMPVEILLAATDGRTGEPGDPRDDRQAASTRAARLRRRKQAPPALVKPRVDRVPSQPNRGLVDHTADLPRLAENGNPQGLSQSDARPPLRHSVILRSVLSQLDSPFTLLIRVRSLWRMSAERGGR